MMIFSHEEAIEFNKDLILVRDKIYELKAENEALKNK